MKVGIAGAGIMGRLLAFAFQKAGWKVSLYDQYVMSAQANCSYAAAGLLTPVAELEKADPIIFHLGTAALTQHWHDIINGLSEAIFFQKTGSLVLSHPRDIAEVTRFVSLISDKLQTCQPKSTVLQKIRRTEIQELEPDISKFQEGYYFSHEGQLDNQALMAGLLSALLKNGVEFFENTVIEKVLPGKIVLNRDEKQFDLVVDCRGLGGESTFPNLRGLRGELIWLHALDVHVSRPVRFLHPRYSLYIVPRPHQTYLIGASEFESEDQSEISVRTTMELLTAAYAVHPGFAEARILKTVTQCRPTLPNHLPSIKYADGFVGVNGLYRHGFLIAPSLMMDVMNWVQHGVSSVCYPQLWEKYQC